MTRLLPLVLLALSLVLPAAAQEVTREIFPSDYTPSPCAPSTEAVCASFPKNRMAASALTFRGYELHNEWIDANWDQMLVSLKPLCARIASCLTVKDNDWPYCLDLAREEMLASCKTRFAAGTYDRDQCIMFNMTYYIGFGSKKRVHDEAQACTNAQPPAERTLVAWMEPAKLAIDHDGLVTLYAYDAETRIPVRARLKVEGPSKVKLTSDGPIITAGYPVKWKLRLPRVPNADGHTDLVVPNITLEATGYKPLVMPTPVEIPRMIVEMSPSPDKLKVGKNVITVTARDAATGKPVSARVMAEDMVLGETNQPLELELTRRDKRPEIWVTSLYDHYSDVVVARRGK
jgi:hypothetical protein